MKKIIFTNIPNLLSVSRIFLTFVVMYMIFNNVNIVGVVVVFSIAALTDLLDGKLARKFKWESEFGRKADMIADRFLWIGTTAAFVITFSVENKLVWYHGLQLLGIMIREIISIPFAIIGFFSGTAIPKARYIAKVTTFIQGFVLPALILSVFYPLFLLISIPLSLATAVTGFMSAIYYIHDVQRGERKIRKKKKGKGKKNEY